MQRSPDIDRIALLLTGLGPELAEPALANLDDEQAEQVRSRLNAMSDDPPEAETLNDVMDDFEMFMKFALRTANAPSNWADEDFDSSGDDEGQDDEVIPAKPKLKIFQPSGDPIDDLQRLLPAQIAGAIADELPRTISIVLSCLDNKKTAEILGFLPDDVQSGAFLALQKNTVTSQELVAQVVRTTVQKAALIAPDEFETPDLDQQTANLLRSMPRGTRNRLMQHLEQAEPETAERLQELLYMFDDLLNYDNRSVQKVLGQIETSVLVTALQDADTAISERIFENLSKRARLSLSEEMEFSKRASEAEVEQSRKTIAQLIAQLDRDGEMNEL